MRRHTAPLLLIATLSLGTLAACRDDGGDGGGDGSTETTETTAVTGTSVGGDGAPDTTVAGGDTTPDEGGGSEGDGAPDEASEPLVTQFCDQVAVYLDGLAAYSEDPEGTDLAAVDALFQDVNATLTELNSVMEEISPADRAIVRACARSWWQHPRRLPCPDAAGPRWVGGPPGPGLSGPGPRHHRSGR